MCHLLPRRPTPLNATPDGSVRWLFEVRISMTEGSPPDVIVRGDDVKRTKVEAWDHCASLAVAKLKIGKAIEGFGLTKAALARLIDACRRVLAPSASQLSRLAHAEWISRTGGALAHHPDLLQVLRSIKHGSLGRGRWQSG